MLMPPQENPCRFKQGCPAACSVPSPSPVCKQGSSSELSLKSSWQSHCSCSVPRLLLQSNWSVTTWYPQQQVVAASLWHRQGSDNFKLTTASDQRLLNSRDCLWWGPETVSDGGLGAIGLLVFGGVPCCSECSPLAAVAGTAWQSYQQGLWMSLLGLFRLCCYCSMQSA